jgi:hypothetical protein
MEGDMKHLILILMVAICCRTATVEAANYGVAHNATPVLATPAFPALFGGHDGKTLKTDRCGQVRELEFIALSGTTFRLLSEIRTGATTIFRVETDDYPLPSNRLLYVDSRFIELKETEPQSRLRKLPAVSDIIASLKGAVGTPYVWGGNVRQGVPDLVGMYYQGSIPPKSYKSLILAGVDCSGLLYQATGGWTPRNTTQLITFGRGMPVAGRTADELAELLQPLDLIAWNGHVIIVLDRETVIESRLACGKPGNGGVVSTPLAKRLAEVMRTRRPVDAWPVEGKQEGIFVVRRWIDP